MGLHQKQMDRIKIGSYRDCVWYMPKIDKCKLPGICGKRHSKCFCKKGQLNEFCIWITKFLKSAPKDVEIDEAGLEDCSFCAIEDIDYDVDFLNKLAKIFNGDKKNA